MEIASRVTDPLANVFNASRDSGSTTTQSVSPAVEPALNVLVLMLA